MRAFFFTSLALLAAGCGSGQPSAGPAGGEPAAATVERKSLVPGTRCERGAERPLGSSRVAYVAWARGTTRAYARPGGELVRTFGKINVNGVSTVFGVLGMVLDRTCDPVWYRVQLPIRPNGATGYVRVSAVGLYRVRTRIEIDLSDRRLVFLRNGRRVLRAVVAIGSSATPTPTGRYYVNQRLRPTNPGGPFGPAAIGISAFSPVLTGWAQGGPIAIHGTNDPASIGRAISNGCLRLPNDVLEPLYEATPPGTPVVIRG